MAFLLTMYACHSQNLLVVPDNVSDEQAVFTEPLAAAVRVIDQVEITAGYCQLPSSGQVDWA